MASYRLLAYLRLLVVVLVILLSKTAEGKKGMIECLADLEGDSKDPNNIYHCKETVQVCCQEGGEPSCCTEKQTSVAVWEQVALWGSLFGLLFFVAFVMWCCRTDGNQCRTHADGTKRCCCYRNKDKYEDKRPPSPGTNMDRPDDLPPGYEDLNINMEQA